VVGTEVVLMCVVNISVTVITLSVSRAVVILPVGNVVGISAVVLPVSTPGATGEASSGNSVVGE
jgi:hypothetical protein